jgi:hypothetical protein
LMLLSATWIGLAACGDDDDVGGDVAEPADESDAGAGSDDGGAGDAAAPAGSSPGGQGLVVIDGERYEFEIEFCFGSEESTARIAGPGTTPDGEPFWVEVRWGLGGPVATQLGVGVVEADVTSEGDPHWSSQLDDGAQYVSFDDGMSISYEAPFAQLALPNEPEVPGSVDASCTPA